MTITLLPQRRIMSVWRAALVLAACVPAFLAPLFLRPGSLLWGLATGLWAAVFLFIYLYYLPARLRGLSLSVQEDELVIKSGVFSRVIRKTSIRSIQFVTVRSSPLHRRWKLATLIIDAPGGRMLMSGLSAGEAERLISVLL